MIFIFMYEKKNDNFQRIFDNLKSENYIKTLRIGTTTKIVILELNNTEMYKHIDYWNFCYNMDDEKYHTPLLYLVWAQKSFFVKEAITENPFNSSWFFWC